MPSVDLPARKQCPSRQALLAYCAGSLPSHVLETLANHVAACPECQSALEEVQSETPDRGSLVDKLRRCVAPPPLVERASEEKSTLSEASHLTPPMPPWLRKADQAVRADTATRSDSAASTIFGQYELLEEVGHGGMGVVHKARQTRLNRLVAIKMIRAGMYAGAGERVRFRVEGEAIARLQHPHVVQVHEFNEHDGQLYLCMEFLEGGSLAAKLAGTGIPVREAAVLVEILAVAVHAAHQRNIIHRDLKPGNVLLTADGIPKIGDFGLAKLLDTEGGQTASDGILGTPSYMAPEQAEGRAKEVGPLADVYALGAILYEALTGRPPFKGATKMETLDQVRTMEPAPPRRLRREAPRDLEAICLKCLAKKPAQRYASAEALAQDLRRWLNGEPTLARPMPWYGRAWRRPIVRLAAALLLVLSGAVSVLVYQRLAPDPDLPLKEMQARLMRGEPVALIGARGRPAWSRWWMGEKSGGAFLDQDGSFVLHGSALTLLELLPDTSGHRQYRIDAEMRHLKGGKAGDIGLYFAGMTSQMAKLPILSFLLVSYDDIHDALELYQSMPAQVRKGAPPPKGNRVRVAVHQYVLGTERTKLNRSIDFLSPELFKAAGSATAAGAWRTVQIEVTPSAVRIFADARLVGEVKAKQPSLETFVPSLGLPGGIGLYVDDSYASFRNVRVEPLGTSTEPN